MENSNPAILAIRGKSVLSFFVSSCLLVGAAPAWAATLTVNSTADAADATPGDGICVTAGGECTLRAAIHEANASAGVDTIAFNISGVGPHTIQPDSALPTITDPVVIDGRTQPDFTSTPVIELNGTNAGASVIGLHITAGNSTVRGLVINSFDGDGINLETNGGNVIEGNFIGTDVTGTEARGNSVGIETRFASGNTIGGTAAGAGNVISGNSSLGLLIIVDARDGLVQGNFIGTDVNGTAPLPNRGGGIFLNTTRKSPC